MLTPGNTPITLNSTKEGTVTCFKLWHPFSIFFLIDFTEDGILISSRDTQSQKASLPIDTTDE